MRVKREQIELADEELEQLFSDEFQICCTANNLEFYEAGEMDRIRAARKEWSDQGRTLDDSEKTLSLEGIQATRGQRRQTLAAIKIGDYEAVYCG